MDTSFFRILDASLNRAGEGLRVVEDLLRFVLDDPFLTEQAKSLRHDLTAAAMAIPTTNRHAARETQHDVGTQLSTSEEAKRVDGFDVCAANFKRAEQSLRSLEEYGKLVDAGFARQMESLRYRLYTLEKAADLGRSSRDRLKRVRLCVLVDGGRSVDDFANLIKELAFSGVPMIQLRDKRLTDAKLTERAKLMCSICRRPQMVMPQGEIPYAPLCVVNDRPDVAAAAHADGVHLGQEDMTVKDARAIVGTRMLIGMSTHTIEQARAAVLDGANYLGAGPTFTSRSKSFDEFSGVGYLREVAAEIRLPTFAIGGISRENLQDVLATGISRVAVIGAVTGASEPGCAASELLGMLNCAGDELRTAAKAASPSLTSDL